MYLRGFTSEFFLRIQNKKYNVEILAMGKECCTCTPVYHMYNYSESNVGMLQVHFPLHKFCVYGILYFGLLIILWDVTCTFYHTQFKLGLLFAWDF